MSDRSTWHPSHIIEGMNCLACGSTLRHPAHALPCSGTPVTASPRPESIVTRPSDPQFFPCGCGIYGNNVASVTCVKHLRLQEERDTLLAENTFLKRPR